MPGKVRCRSFSICCAKSSMAALKGSCAAAARACLQGSGLRVEGTAWGRLSMVHCESFQKFVPHLTPLRA